MIEEPYRWVEAIANRREYIETQLATGSPITALSCGEGILFLTLSRGRQKVFEIYDRIAMGAIGHPGDIERLRMAAIELASTEGFTRSAADVSLRRLTYYSLSPVLKTAFEQVYGAPYLARMIFAEVGLKPTEDLFLTLEYDGAITASGAVGEVTPPRFTVISGTTGASKKMEELLAREHDPECTLERAVRLALDTWSLGNLAAAEEEMSEMPSTEKLLQNRAEQLGSAAIEAALLERAGASAIRYRSIPAPELKELTKA